MKTVLCSGGLDSICALADCVAKYPQEEIVVLFFDYGQTAYLKEEYAILYFLHYLSDVYDIQGIALNIRIHSTNVDLYSSLYSKFSLPTPKILRKGKDTVANQGLAWRNFSLCMLALSMSETIGSDELWVGFGYEQEASVTVWDSSWMAVDKLNELIAWKQSLVTTSDKFVSTAGTLEHTKIVSPMYRLDRTQYIQEHVFDYDLDLSWSCYQAGDTHCGKCSSCLNRIEALGHL